MLGLGYGSHYVPVAERLELQYSWLYWAVEMGIAPGQPFQVAISEPYSYRCSYEYDEWDTEWSSELICVAHCSKLSATRRWEKFLQKLERRRLYAVYKYHLDTQRIRQDTGAMYVHCHSFLKYGITQEASISAAVRTRHHQYSHPIGKYIESSWGHGGNDQKDKEAALAELEVTACAENPYLCPEVIRAMEVRRNP
jgi:hypothetical protein